MGSYIGIGYSKNSADNLSIVLNRSASGALEVLFDKALNEKYPAIYETVMEVYVLDQMNFYDLEKKDFNIAIKAIRNYLTEMREPTENQLFQKLVWNNEIEPLIKQDKRYEDPNV
ncbi:MULTISPECIES: hypothetical protein [Providencia]|uniref:hypothetical protein n=1 Tax=Providencia TaxID=586 RepID=UPI0014095996|nr:MULTISPECIES: hypothetical protein [Providencia]MBQ0536747.1 hypothetical protein [Providencia huaxiensis]MBQ0590846.1 hypothetical protein [Providencia huaxiensis]MCG9536290.1 hypothetical protein [Providencia huaxiensis]MDI7241516.1 hypothetical protein [Providencia huaxiensis]